MRILNLLLLLPGVALGQSALLPTGDEAAEPTRAPLRAPLRAPKATPTPPPPRPVAPLTGASERAHGSSAPSLKAVPSAAAPVAPVAAPASTPAASLEGTSGTQPAVARQPSRTPLKATTAAQPAVAQEPSRAPQQPNPGAQPAVAQQPSRTPLKPNTGAQPAVAEEPSRAPQQPNPGAQPAVAQQPSRTPLKPNTGAQTAVTQQPSRTPLQPAASSANAPSQTGASTAGTPPATPPLRATSDGLQAPAANAQAGQGDPAQPASPVVAGEITPAASPDDTRAPLTATQPPATPSNAPSTPADPHANTASPYGAPAAPQREILLTPDIGTASTGPYDIMATPPPPGSAGANDPTYPYGSPHGRGQVQGSSAFGTLPPATGPKPEIGLMISQTAFGALSAAGTALIPYLLFQKAGALGTSDPTIANLITLLAIAGTPLAVSSTQVGIANQSRFYFSEEWPSQLAGLATQGAVIGAFYLAGGFPVQGLSGFNRPNGELVLLIGTLAVVPLASMAVINLTKMPRSIGGYAAGPGALRVSPDGAVHVALPTPVPMMDATRPGEVSGLLVPLATGAF